MVPRGEIPRDVKLWLGQRLFEHVPNNIAVIDRDYNIVLANKNFTDVFGSCHGKRCHEVYKRQPQRCDQCLAQKTFLDGKTRINDEAGFDRNGKPAHYVVTTAPIYDEVGQVAYVIEMSYDVTETKSLQRSYNLLFDRVPCYVSVINRDLRVVRGNEMLRETFGECVGELCYEVFKHRHERCPDCPALRTFADGKSYSAEQVGTDKEGDPTRYVVSTAPLSRTGEEFSYVIEMSTDVTAVRSLSDQLLTEASFRRNLTESTFDALVATDVKQVVTIFNKAAEELFGVPAAEVLGRSGERFIPPALLKQLARGEEGRTVSETQVEDATGQKIPVRCSGLVLADQGRTVGCAVFYQDLRELKRLERENLDNERLAAVGQTVAQLAHGIKNILNGLQGGMYIIKSGMRSGSKAKLERGWGMLERNVDRITELVQGFLQFSKGHSPEVTEVDPAQVVNEVAELYRDMAQQRGIAVTCKVPQQVAPAPFDIEDLRSSLENLVANAIDACQSSERAGEVTIALTDQNDTLIFEVTDNGCGMDYEIKSKVFTTFFTTKGLGGTGLGLLTTRKVVQGHGGRISVDSSPGQGSTFRMTFSRSRLPAPTGEPAES